MAVAAADTAAAARLPTLPPFTTVVMADLAAPTAMRDGWPSQGDYKVITGQMTPEGQAKQEAVGTQLLSHPAVRTRFGNRRFSSGNKGRGSEDDPLSALRPTPTWPPPLCSEVNRG